MPLRTDALRHLRRWLPVLAVVAAACSPDRYPQTALRPISDFARIGDDIHAVADRVWYAVVKEG